MRIRTALTALALVGASGAVAAQDYDNDRWVSRFSPYIGAGVGQSDFSIAGDWGAGVDTDDDSDTAWRVFGGMRVFDIVGLELGYIDFGEAEGTGGASAEAEAIDLVALASVPVPLGRHQIDLFGKAGGYWWDSDVSGAGPGNNLRDSDDFDYTYGVGVQYFFTNFGVRAEWQQYNDLFGDTNTDTWMGSLLVRF